MGRLAPEDELARRARALPEGANPADFSEALARGLAVLEAFSSDRDRLTQAEVAKIIGVSRATVRRAILTLEFLGYLRNDGRSYELTPKVMSLTGRYLGSNPVTSVLQPACDRIGSLFDAACSVAVLDRDDALIVARFVPNHLIAIGTGIGFRTPARVSSLGKVLIAHLPDDEAAPYIDDAGGLTQSDVAAVRSDGFSYVADDIEAGKHSIAVPVARWDGTVVAALHVGATKEEISPDRMLGEVLDRLRDEVAERKAQLV
ncbi:helix-turn-helix domain-containing protein [Nocardioides sp. LMS-CY]|uniref:IclR family transcriptional regulator domain-containing protein n=1 Tax=Nocardioides sp. (strain LMS-CY) TaxID=2840457 RepID=UPI001BFFE1CE|nr:helix-turn-helix domain-containing protein [Nocardioides sp. LMS-CY]QWF22301.1 helix-turn-helix domain-containing protein [Nocardioides sp. LMS-CY]